MGSSPRVWGQVCRYGKEVIKMRIIPTRMGTSLTLRSPYKETQDHPHAYGDKPPPFWQFILFKGSSPRVWGQETNYFMYGTRARIIPTRMGTSVDKHIVILIQQDHPHAYGDKLSGAFFQANFLGSSPRVWGRVLSSLRDFLPYRIIPMRMGTSLLITLGQQTL